MLIAAAFLLFSLFSAEDFPETQDFINKYYILYEGENSFTLIHFIDQNSIITYIRNEDLSYKIEKDIFFKRNEEREIHIFFLPTHSESTYPMGGLLEVVEQGFIIRKLPNYQLAGMLGENNSIFCTNPDTVQAEFREISRTEFNALVPIEYPELIRLKI